MKLNGVDITVRYIEHSNAFIPEPEISKRSKFWIEQNPHKYPMTWEQANNYAQSVGNGWRLPTVEDLQTISDTRLRTKFQTKPYWTSESESDSTAVTVGFLTGVPFSHNKQNKFYLMLVKGDSRRLELVPIKEAKLKELID